MIAFLSRKLDGKKLHTRSGEVDKNDLKGMDEDAKGYFNNLCDMKDAIQSLKLGRDKSHAWRIFMEKLQTLDDIEKGDVYEKNERETLTEIVRIAEYADKIGRRRRNVYKSMGCVHILRLTF